MSVMKSRNDIYCIKCQLDYFVPNALVNSVNKIPEHLTKRTVAVWLIQNLSQKKNERQKCLKYFV